MSPRRLPIQGKGLAWLILSLIPIVALAALIHAFAVNVPFWDEWILSDVLIKYREGTLGWDDIFRQHNESRKIFPKLFMLAIADFAHGDVRVMMWTSFLFVCAIAACLFILERKSGLQWSGVQGPAFALTMLVLFSPVQWENWLWGIQMIVFVPFLCIVASLVLFQSRSKVAVKVLLAMGLSTFATFSFANGLLCWMLLFPALLLLLKNEERRLAKGLAVTWIAGFALNVLVYFWGYEKPGEHPSLGFFLLHPLESCLYFLNFLGAPFCFGLPVLRFEAAFLSAALLLPAFILLGGVTLKQPIIREQSVPWIVIGFYAIACDLLCVVGRSGFHFQQASALRYTTFSLTLAIAVIHLAAIAWTNTDILKRSGPATRRCLLSIPILLTGLLVLSSLNGAWQMAYLKQQRRHMKAMLIFAGILPQKPLTHFLAASLPDLIRRADKLGRFGLLHPKMLESPRVPSPQADVRGELTDLRQEPTGKYTASIWAQTPHGKVADMVVLSWEGPKQEPYFFKLATPGYSMRPRTPWAPLPESKQWSCQFLPAELPPGVLQIRAWAVDADTGGFFPLQGSFEVNVPGK